AGLGYPAASRGDRDRPRRARRCARCGAVDAARSPHPRLRPALPEPAALVGAQVLTVWRGAGRTPKLCAAAVLGIVACATLRALPSVWASASDRASSEARVFAPDPFGRASLERWAGDRVREITPGAWARALFEEDTHEHFHLTARTGLPTFHMSPEPDLLLRERIEDTSDASLRRFNVRWVVGL